MALEEFKLLEKYGYALLPYGVAKTEQDAASLAKKIGYPVAMKIISKKITHKTEIDGVKINIKSEQGLKLAYSELQNNVKKHNVTLEGILVQKMARRGLELIIGGKKDPQFGYLIILGFGGIYVEIFRDITARICPINKQEVKEMIEGLKTHPLIEGTRGQKGINIKALEEIMLRTCKFMMKEDILELDLNPVIFDDKGCDLVDIRFRK